MSVTDLLVFHSLCLAAMLSFTDAFQKSCQQQISVNVIHYSVITNCGLHKSAYYFVKVQRNVFLASKAMEGCKERKEDSL